MIKERAKVELNLYLSSDVVSSLFSTVSITLAFILFLMVIQSNIAPPFFNARTTQPNPTPLS